MDLINFTHASNTAIHTSTKIDGRIFRSIYSEADYKIILSLNMTKYFFVIMLQIPSDTCRSMITNIYGTLLGTQRRLRLCACRQRTILFYQDHWTKHWDCGIYARQIVKDWCTYLVHPSLLLILKVWYLQLASIMTRSNCMTCDLLIRYGSIEGSFFKCDFLC